MFSAVRAGEVRTVEPESVGLSSDRLNRYSAAIEAGVDAGHFPGAVAAVARNGKIAFLRSHGFRDREAGLPMTDDAIFRIASMTKPITGVAVMILFEEGHFSLLDPIENYLPAFKNPRVRVKRQRPTNREDWSLEELDEWIKENWDDLTNDEKRQTLVLFEEKERIAEQRGPVPVSLETKPVERPITIRDLLRHTSGLSTNMDKIWVRGDDLAQMIDKLAAQPLKAQPGTRYQYGYSLDVLAGLVEVISGQPFAEFLEDRIFTPLRMPDTAYYVPIERADRLVKMPASYDDGSGEDPFLSPQRIGRGSGGLVSTAIDYMRFCLMLLNDGELDGSRILGRKTVELMRANHMNDVAEYAGGSKPILEFDHGLSFAIRRKPGDIGELGSEGTYYWDGAYGTAFWIDPAENLIGVFMVNGLDYDKLETRPYSPLLEHFTYQAIID